MKNGYSKDINEVLENIKSLIENKDYSMIKSIISDLVKVHHFDKLVPIYMEVFRDELLNKNVPLLNLIKEMSTELNELTFALFNELSEKDIFTKELQYKQ